jgi:hypothetical protein
LLDSFAYIIRPLIKCLTGADAESLCIPATIQQKNVASAWILGSNEELDRLVLLTSSIAARASETSLFNAHVRGYVYRRAGWHPYLLEHELPHSCENASDDNESLYPIADFGRALTLL